MTSDDILTLIDQIAATPGKNDKIAMVTGGAQLPEFVRVLEYAYNPFKRYRMIKLPAKTHVGMKQFDDGTWQILDRLISRELTGDRAWNEVMCELDCLTAESADLLGRIIRKDMKAGFSESTCNKAVKKLIPEFPYMRCSLPKDTDLAVWPWGEGVFSQEKADGMFANIDHEECGLVRITSRQGSEFPIEKFEAMTNDIRARLTAGYQNHGEIIVLRDGVVCKRQDGNGVLNGVLKGGDFLPNEVPVYLVWDQIPLSAVVPKGKYKVNYRRRITSLLQQLKTNDGLVRLIPTRIVRSLKEAYAHAVEMMKAGKEGSVIKHPAATWKDGTSNEQIKIKLEFEVDLKIVAIVPGKAHGKNAGRAGSITCRSACGMLLVDVTVKNEAVRDHIDANPDEWIDQIIAVTANDIMEPGQSSDVYSLYLPRMAEASYRDDKIEADSLIRIKQIKEAAIFGEALMKEAA